MTELQEITEGKTLEQLEKELDFQVNRMGEAPNGCICSFIKDRILTLKKNKIN